MEDFVQAEAISRKPGMAVRYPASEKSSGKPCHITLK
jgi:hypothetical protein